MRKALVWFSIVIGLFCFGIASGSDKEAGYAPAPLGDGVTKYHALLIANNEYTGDNDDFETALTNWGSWTGVNATITKSDNRSGANIIADINAWIAGIDDDDVAVFFYSGHAGIRGESADERVNDPVADNDPKRTVDEVIGELNAQRRIIDPARDDAIKAALGALPANTTLLAVFDQCYSHGQVLGTTDNDVLTNIAVMTIVPEAQGTGGGWTQLAISGMYDSEPNGKADADEPPHGNQDGSLTVEEWHHWAQAHWPSTRVVSNLAGPAVRPICTGFTGGAAVPGGGGDMVKGEDGSGICSDSDWGDLPAMGELCGGVRRYYHTTSLDSGPSYNEWTLQRLGRRVDSEPDGQPGCGANIDDVNSWLDDEDGVIDWTSSGVTVVVRVDHPVPNDYRLDAWFDLDDDGHFTGEHVIDSRFVYDGAHGGLLQGLATGEYYFAYVFPFDPRMYYSRFRLTFGIPISEEILSYDPVPNYYDAGDGGAHGEVEDYYPSVPTKTESESWGSIKERFK